MKQRLLTAVIGIPVTLTIIYFSHTYVWEAAVFILTSIGLYEALGCIGLKKNLYISVLTYAYGAAGVLFLFRSYQFVYHITCIYIILLLGTCVFFKNKVPFNDVAAVGMVAAYTVNGMFSLIALRRIEDVGIFMIFLVFIGAWFTDGFAFFVGKACGKHKLIPEISPKKTVEGAIGGVVFCTLGYVIFGFIASYFFNRQVNFLALVITGMLISLFSMLGDLILSALKRTYGIKDFGNLLPGHGGVLDRFDSIFAISPILLMICGGDIFYLIK